LIAKSDKDGAYQFLEVRPATYVLSVSATGFAAYKQTGLVLLVGTPTTNDIKMQLGSVATTVEVVTSTQAINTRTPQWQRCWLEYAASIACGGRDPYTILSAQPGVVRSLIATKSISSRIAEVARLTALAAIKVI